MAELRSMEEWISLTVEVDTGGRLRIEGVVLDALGIGNRLSFSIDGLDQSYLSPIIDSLQSVENNFPVIGTL